MAQTNQSGMTQPVQTSQTQSGSVTSPTTQMQPKKKISLWWLWLIIGLIVGFVIGFFVF